MSGEPEGLQLHLERVLPAPTQRVFEACVDARQLAQWWGPTGFTSPGADLDVRPGGSYRIEMQPPEGAPFHLRGEYREIDPPRRLAFTFEWEEPDPDDRETVVTLSFVDHPDGARLVVDQGPFATRARWELHRTGWAETLERLERFLG